MGRCAWPLIFLVAACSSNKPQGDAGRFYTEVDATGRARIVEIQPLPPRKVVTNPLPADQSAGSVTDGAAAVSQGIQQLAPEKTPAYRMDVFAPDAEFVDSGWLESRNFNPEDKKKFAWVPDGTGQMRPMFFAENDGALQVDEQAAASLRQHELRWASLLPQDEWHAMGLSQLPALSSLDKLETGHAYRPVQFCRTKKACDAWGLRFDWPSQTSGVSLVLRMRSYLSQPSCPQCVQWPEVVVLGAGNEILRVYAAEPKGIKPANWRSYASFYQDIDVNPETDAGIILLMPASTSLESNGKKYRNVSNGEISFTWIQ